jgi:hypothetical protein
MWLSLLHILHTAFNLSFSYMGTSALAVGAGLAVFVIREYFLWREGGMNSVKTRWKGGAGLGVLATLVIWIILFAFCLAKAVYDDHQALVKTNADKYAQLKEVKSKNSQLITDLDNLTKQSKQREVRPNQPSKELEEARTALAKATRQSQELEETKAALAARTQETNELKKKAEESSASAINKKKVIESFVGQLSKLEKSVNVTAIVDYNDLGSYIFTYNQIVRSLKKELPNDSYIEQIVELRAPTSAPTYNVLLSAMRTLVPDLRVHLELYLK